MKKLLPFIIFSLYLTIPAQTELSGTISGKTFKPAGNPYLVTETIIISGEKPTTIKPGCVFLFNPFTEIEVSGPLIVSGTTDSPVVFTSINDVQYYQKSEQVPNPFDWNGIVIKNDAGEVRLSDFHIAFSVFGIKSKKDDIVIERGMFRQNGQFHFTINDKIQPVTENILFNYTKKKESKPQTDKIKTSSWVRPVAISAIAAGCLSLGGMGYFIYKVNDYSDKYNRTLDNSDADNYAGKYDKSVSYSVITGVIGGILIPTGAFLLIRDNKKRGRIAEKVTVSPVAGEANGIMLIYHF